jgi:hypothetical protein
LGKFEESLAAYQRGHALGSKRTDWKYPSDRWVREARRLVQFDDRLSVVLAGKAQPDNPDEQLALADFCKQHKDRPATAARLYGGAFAWAPQVAGDLRQRQRYNAACAAALAGSGQGKDAASQGAMQRLHWRRQALTWLCADLRAWEMVLVRGHEQARPVVPQAMQHWLANADLAGVRDKGRLARLPEEERAAWARLWAGVADLLAQAKESQPKDKEKPTRP